MTSVKKNVNSPAGRVTIAEQRKDFRKGKISPAAGLPTVTPICPEHRELVKHYCKRCNVSICGSCVTSTHTVGDHQVKKVSVIHREQREETKRIIKQADEKVLECEQTVQELTVLKRLIRMSLTVQETTVDAHVALAIAKVRKEAIILKFILREKEQLRIEQASREISRLRAHAEEITMARNAAQKLLDNTQKHKYVEEHGRIIDNIKRKFGTDIKMCVSRNPVIGRTKCVFDIPFTVDVTSYGLVQIKECRLKLIQEFGNYDGLCDISSTSSGSLVVCDRHAKKIYSYRQLKNGQYKKRSAVSLSLKKATEVSCVAVSEEDNYLISRSTHVEVYLPSGKYEGILKVKNKDKTEKADINVHTIKMTSNGRILIADRKMSAVIIISLDGTIVQTLPIRINPRRIAILPHGHIAVSDSKMGKVCVIDLESGTEVRCFNIQNAKGLHYHRQSDCILVGRCLQVTNDGTSVAGTGVIEQYCSTTGRLVACIAEGLYCPQNMYLTRNGMLAVADYKTVKIYKVNMK